MVSERVGRTPNPSVLGVLILIVVEYGLGVHVDSNDIPNVNKS